MTIILGDHWFEFWLFGAMFLPFIVYFATAAKCLAKNDWHNYRWRKSKDTEPQQAESGGGE